MRRRHFNVALAGAACGAMLLPGRVLAQDASRSPPPELEGLRLQGVAQMRYFSLLVYDIRLWVREPVTADNWANRPVALELQYARSLSGREIARRSLLEMRRQARLTEAQSQRWLDEMTLSFPDVRSGDRLTGVHEPTVGAQFFSNGRPVHRVDEPDFSRLFFGIWLAPQTSEPSLRHKLLGVGLGRA